MKKNIEVELRGPLDDRSYKKLKSFLKKNGKLEKKQKRLLIDYSTFIEGIGERKLDVRTRITNGKVELIVKRGKFGGKSREEASIFVENSDIESALLLMNMLGYSKGVAADRRIERYRIKNIEIAIQDVVYFGNNKVHSRFFEAEMMSDEKGKANAEEKVKKLLSEMDLSVFEEKEWYEYIKKLNSEANEVFCYGGDDVKKVKKFINKK